MAVKARDQVTVSVSVDVASVDIYYKLQASTATAPNKPTTASPSDWTTTEPVYDGTSTNTLYTCQKTTLTDGTFYWSAVSKSTAYEAAKASWNLANSVSNGLTALGDFIGTRSGKKYTEVEWVESDGHQMVQLDWIPNLNGQYGFDLDFANYNTRNTTGPALTDSPTINRTKSGFILGARDSSAASGKQFVLGCYTPGYFYVGTGTNYDPHMYYDGRRQQCSYRNGVYTAPDGQTYNMPCGMVHPTWGMVIFALSNAATKSSYAFFSSTRLYSCKFYEDDTLAVDLVGAIRNSDNMTGLYDKIADRFWPCAGLQTGDAVREFGENEETLLDQTLAINPLIVDTKEFSSRLWTGDAPTIKKLEDGQQITYRLRYPSVSEAQATELAGLADSGASYNVYLRLRLADGTYTSWIPCYYQGVTRLTTHYPAGSDIRLTYHENRVNTVGAAPFGWWGDANYNTNDNTYDRRLHNNAIKASIAITAAHLICGDSSGYKNIVAEATFDLSYPILYAYSAIAINKTGTATYEAYPNVKFSTTGAIENGVANAMLYLKGTITGNMFTVASTNFLTTVVPIEEDGYFYIPLGVLVSSTNGYFATSKDLYAFIDGRFRQVTPTEVVSTQLIYISQPSGTLSVDSITVWITTNTDSQNTWTTKRPTYDTNYPVLFVATQTKRLDSTVTCTQPLKDDTTTVIDGGHITTGTIDANRIFTTVITAINANVSDTINANKIDAQNLSIGQSQVTGLTTSLSGITDDISGLNTSVTNASKRTYVSIRATAVDYASNTATLEATLYIDGVATTTNVTYAWLKDGTAISGATSRTYSVPASNGLDHAYSCKCVATV